MMQIVRNEIVWFLFYLNRNKLQKCASKIITKKNYKVSSSADDGK